MFERQVRKTRKDNDGNILALCNPEESWSPRLKKYAIHDIESGSYNYYVLWPEGKRTDIRVVNDPRKGKYLRTDRDNTERNNLDDLLDC